MIEEPTRDRTRTSRAAEFLWRRRNPRWAAGRPGHHPPHMVFGPRDLPRMVVDRVAVRRRSQRLPWITGDSLDLLETLLRPDDRVVEWGSGGTTPWFAERVAHVVSIEGSDQWHAALTARLEESGVTNVDLHLVSAAELGYETEEHERAYVEAAPEFGPESVDVAFVDGEYRDSCTVRAIELLRPGGLLVLDNAETYLPTSTRSPWRVDRPATERWRELAGTLSGWRHVWTTNGVWDTAVWIKP